MKTKRKIIHIDKDLCDGCGECVPSCAEGAIRVIDGKARLVGDLYCDGLGACLGHCPKGALEIIEREAEDFDGEAVKKLQHSGQETACPFVREQALGHCEHSHKPVSLTGSALLNWPVQLRLVSPKAPFLKGADLLIAADCTAFAYGGFHGDFLRGQTLLIGCPKLDNPREYVERLTAIFKEAGIRRLTVLVMEVPCCQGMTAIAESALRASGKSIPFEKAVIGTGGEPSIWLKGVTGFLL